MKMRLKKNDTVVVISGKDKGKRGKVLKVDTKKDSVLVEGINQKKKYTRATQEGAQGSLVHIEHSINPSNVMFFCEKCKKGVRLGVTQKDATKSRVCKKCGKSID
ncbi:MAG TPA: 50S ribosomal protein L24 [Spirochaetota bacterium]|nr:50S ribosomal protein L24 [Spirochaetota bacterium]